MIEVVLKNRLGVERLKDRQINPLIDVNLANFFYSHFELVFTKALTRCT